MAQFTYTHFISYIGPAGDNAFDPVSFIASSPTLLDDGETDGVFTTGDTVTSRTLDNPTLLTGTYIGTTTVDGQEWPVFTFPNGETLVYLSVAPSLPLTPILQVNEGDTFDAPCFLSGTMIATPEGATPVETLRIGDTILTAAGAPVAVKWIGHRSVAARFSPADRLLPVRIRAGALGEGLPRRDLQVTADHALLLDGVLVTAGALVGAMGISTVPLSELGGGYTVYHIETEAHEIILAEGVPAETYIDYVGRQAFENHGEYLALYGEDRTIPEMAQPRVTSARQLPPELRARLRLSHAA
jgi:hypothetical protein